MRSLLPHPAWLILTTIGLTVVGTVFHYWWEYDRVQTLAGELKLHSGSLDLGYRGPDWLARWASTHPHEAYSEWFRTDVKGLNITTTTGWSMDWTRITDTGLDHLVALPNLKYIYTRHTRVTNEGIDQIKIKRPGLEFSPLERSSFSGGTARRSFGDYRAPAGSKK